MGTPATVDAMRKIPLALLLLLASSCSNSRGNGLYLPPPVNGQAQVGPLGGVANFTGGSIAGTSVTVPPGAVSQTVTIAISPGLPVATGAATPVGPPVLATPNALAFAAPVTVKIPYSASLIPSGKTVSDIVILQENEATGAITTIAPASVDTTSFLVIFPTTSFCTFQAAIFDAGAPTVTGTASPLGGTPPAIPASGGQTVTITGTNLFAGAQVAFGSTTASGNAVSADSTGTQLSVLAPAGTGTVSITVTNLDGQKTTFTNAFQYAP
jgi:hypothetical protein